MPYIPNSPSQIKEMLRACGVKSPADFYSDLPEEIRIKDDLDIPAGISEQQLKRKLLALSDKNRPLDKFNSFLGAGCYDHYIPAALSFIISQPEFSTAYTPYQAECSQGALQAIYEYQSYICRLTGMDVSNASLLDGGSALAEAVLMSARLNRRNTVIISEALNPEYKEVLKTYLKGHDLKTYEVQVSGEGKTDLSMFLNACDKDTSCLVFQSPNFFGVVENLIEIKKLFKDESVLKIMVTNPLSLAVFKEPSSFGFDIVCGDGQPLGGGLRLGGACFGFLAAKKEYLRQVPGRIVGKTLDSHGNVAYCLTLQAREQHIRREKARSNICSNQSLNALASAVYLSLLGRKGLREVALTSMSNAHYLRQGLSRIRGIKLTFSPLIFNEFVWFTDNAPQVLNELYKKGIIAGYYIGKHFNKYNGGVLSCCTEKKTKEEINDFINSLAEVLHGEKAYIR
ncbi:MAG: aminomethyl-transferring glycine dehydrogenase subunit GcvPA [Candidatus Omnitrophica bacterium]|nr:aminomethyl-transferring glycine dehydrogenase subunit GcvPA [Candidatus Omnitrophota bacterium]MBD3269278.1 aminomethyl-transferring glycine dehydrogenase subunit GcvPA [Candidatus Omnitrophota bacterium]